MKPKKFVKRVKKAVDRNSKHNGYERCKGPQEYIQEINAALMLSTVASVAYNRTLQLQRAAEFVNDERILQRARMTEEQIPTALAYALLISLIDGALPELPKGMGLMWEKMGGEHCVCVADLTKQAQSVAVSSAKWLPTQIRIANAANVILQQWLAVKGIKISIPVLGKEGIQATQKARASVVLQDGTFVVSRNRKLEYYATFAALCQALS